MAPEGAARAALERLDADGIAPREILDVLARGHGAIGRTRRHRLSPREAQRAATTLRGLRRVLEALEAVRPYDVGFKAMGGTAEQGAVTWSVADYVSDWVPRYLEACARGDVTTGIVGNGRPADRAVRWCAETLGKLIRARTGRPGYPELGALLFAAFPRHFHPRTQGRITTDADDHADAARALLRRAERPDKSPQAQNISDAAPAEDTGAGAEVRQGSPRAGEGADLRRPIVTTPDQVWKNPAGEAEAFDRLMASRIAAVATRAIPAESLEAYWRQWDDPAIAEDVASAPTTLVDETGWLYGGEGHVTLPDGSRWLMVNALMSTDVHDGGPGDNAFLQRLHALLLEHAVVRAARHGQGPGLPHVMLNMDTLDVRRVFCTECSRWIDLAADAEEADETLGPWED